MLTQRLRSARRGSKHPLSSVGDEDTRSRTKKPRYSRQQHDDANIVPLKIAVKVSSDSSAASLAKMSRRVARLQSVVEQWKIRCETAENERKQAQNRLHDLHALVKSSTTISDLQRKVSPFPYPVTWEGEVQHLHSDNCLVVTLNERDHPLEWAQIVKVVQASHPAHVVSVQRIQNRTLWQRFCEFEQRKCASKSALDVAGEKNPLHLFHGTRSNNPALIYGGTVGFDLKKCQRGVYGHGIYAAQHASYSANGYAHTMLNKLQGGSVAVHYHQLLLVRCATGHMQSGNDSNITHMDRVSRVVDSICVSNNTIYVFRRSSQLYPEYLITVR